METETAAVGGPVAEAAEAAEARPAERRPRGGRAMSGAEKQRRKRHNQRLCDADGRAAA